LAIAITSSVLSASHTLSAHSAAEDDIAAAELQVRATLDPFIPQLQATSLGSSHGIRIARSIKSADQVPSSPVQQNHYAGAESDRGSSSGSSSDMKNPWERD
jgi:hypothetical protein